MPKVIASPYEELLERILASPDDPPTILVYSDSHYATIRAGLSRAKKKYDTVRSFMGEESLTEYRFQYARAKDDPNKVTISLVKVELPTIHYVEI